MGACLSGSVRGPTFMSEQGTQNQALEQTRDSVLRHCEPVGRELLNFVVLDTGIRLCPTPVLAYT